jgi:hypothetical protein
MGIYLNPGNERFQSVLRSEIYIDKTGMLEYTNKVMETEQRYLCVSRPRRFGKSITADMIAAYYGKDCDSKVLFQNLKISQVSGYEEHLNKYYVIQVDMNVFRHKRDRKTRKEITALQAVDLFHMEIIQELKKEFGDCVKENDIDLPAVLTNINQEMGTKFIIIIDEWDTIFREDKTDEEAQKVYIDLLRGLFKDATSKRFLKLAYLTGILPIKKYGTESALNNFDEFTMIRPYMMAEYTGFTEEEAKNLYQMYDMDFEEAKRWYDGYQLGENLHIYNPKSVVDSIWRRKIEHYWTRTETYESLRNYISMNYDGLKDAIIQMLAGGRCRVRADQFQNDMVSFQSKDDILTLLIHLGYLAYDEIKGEVYIPNEEIRSEFKNAVEGNQWEQVIRAINASDELLKATWQKKEDVVAKGIEKVHKENTSILQYNDENSLSCVISLAYYNAVNEYTLIRELPAGDGYADIVFLPRKYSEKPAMVVELKWNYSAEGAIEQIKKKKYASALKEYQGNVLLVGINYDKKKKEYRCKIEQMEK